jgi:hypothetical protein
LRICFVITSPFDISFGIGAAGLVRSLPLEIATDLLVN